MYVSLYKRENNRNVFEKRYNDLKSLSLNLETDLKLSSVPVCEYTVEIATTDNKIEIGKILKLYDDMGILYAAYKVAEVKRITDGIVRVLAKSDIETLEKWTLKAIKYNSETLVAATMDLCFQPTYVKDGKTQLVFIETPSDANSIIVDGFFPEQTARERLQQICLACNLTVRQWFCDPSISLEKTTPNGGVIPMENIFWKPDRQDVDSAGMVLVSSFDGWTQTEPDPSQLPSGKEVVEVHDDVRNQTWWCIKSDNGLQIPNPDNPDGPLVTISDIMIINSQNAQDIQNNLIPHYFRGTEWTLDVINNGQYYPGMKVTFVGTIDPDATLAPFCAGIIKSCDFTFGVQNRSRITVVGDQIMDTGGHVIVHYVHTYEDAEGNEKTMSLGCNRYYSPPGTSITIKHPPIYVDVVGETRIFQPTVAQSTVAVTGDEELTIEYELEVS